MDAYFLLSAVTATAIASWWPYDCPLMKNVHLEVVLTVRHLALQEFIDLHIHVYEQIMYLGIYKAIEDATTLAFFSRLEALDAFVEKHLDLATKVAAP